MSLAMSETRSGPLARHATVGVRVGEGDGAVIVGGGAPIVVQSMTNTDTADIEATTRQVAALARAARSWCVSRSIATRPPLPCPISATACAREGSTRR